MDKYGYIKRGVVPALVTTVIAALATAGSAALTGGTAGAATALTFKYVTVSQWPNSDGTRGFKADIEIGNKAGTTPVNGWTLKFTYPGDEKIGSLDNATYAQAGQDVTITSGPVSAYIPAGSGYVLSLAGLWVNNDAVPVSFDFNGTTYAPSPAAPPPSQSPVPRVGVGAALLSQNAQATYIGVKYGRTPDPLTAGTARLYLVRVTNTGNGPEEITVHSAAAYVAGGSFLWNTTSGQNAAASWTSASPDDVVNIPAGGSFTTTVTVRVPAGTAPATYYAVLWASLVTHPVSGQITPSADAGIREYLRVTP